MSMMPNSMNSHDERALHLSPLSMALHFSLAAMLSPLQQPGVSVVVVVDVVVITQSSGSSVTSHSQSLRSHEVWSASPKHLACALYEEPLQQPAGSVGDEVVVGHSAEQSMYSFISSNTQRGTPSPSVSLRQSRSVPNEMHVSWYFLLYAMSGLM